MACFPFESIDGILLPASRGRPGNVQRRKYGVWLISVQAGAGYHALMQPANVELAVAGMS
jgi:hypothetical protein